MAGKKSRLSTKRGERAAQGGVTLFDRAEKTVVRCTLFGFLPSTLDGVKIWRIGWESMQLDAVTVLRKPCLTHFCEIVAWAVVDDEKYFSARVLHEVLKKLQKCQTIENRSKYVAKLRFFLQRHRAENVGCLPLTKGVDLRLLAYPGPRTMQASVKPKARLITEHHNTATPAGFFFIAGNVFRSQMACFCASARAKRLRGLCSEKPSVCKRRGILCL